MELLKIPSKVNYVIREDALNVILLSLGLIKLIEVVAKATCLLWVLVNMDEFDPIAMDMRLMYFVTCYLLDPWEKRLVKPEIYLGGFLINIGASKYNR